MSSVRYPAVPRIHTPAMLCLSLTMGCLAGYLVFRGGSPFVVVALAWSSCGAGFLGGRTLERVERLAKQLAENYRPGDDE